MRRSTDARRHRWLLPLALWVAACSAPQREAETMAVEATWSPEPPRRGENSVSLTLADRAGRKLTGARVRIEANMSHPGMVPARALAEETAPGTYRAELNLEMAGAWFMVVSAESGRGNFERVIDGVRVASF